MFAAAEFRQGSSPRTIQRRLSALRSFFNFMLRERALDANPAVGVQAPKARKRLPDTMDVDLMTRLLEFRTDTQLGLRDKAIMELFYSSGLRLAELVGLNLGDLDRGDRTVRVLGKGSKTRVVPVGKHALEAIARWLKERAALAANGEQALFVEHSRRADRRLARFRSASRDGRVARVSVGTFTRTCSVIRSRRTCWSRARTCAVCRNCSATPISRRRRSTRTLISSTSPRSTTLPTPARAASPEPEAT